MFRKLMIALGALLWALTAGSAYARDNGHPQGHQNQGRRPYRFEQRRDYDRHGGLRIRLFYNGPATYWDGIGCNPHLMARDMYYARDCMERERIALHEQDQEFAAQRRAEDIEESQGREAELQDQALANLPQRRRVDPREVPDDNYRPQAVAQQQTVREVPAPRTQQGVVIENGRLCNRTDHTVLVFVNGQKVGKLSAWLYTPLDDLPQGEVTFAREN